MGDVVVNDKEGTRIELKFMNGGCDFSHLAIVNTGQISPLSKKEASEICDLAVAVCMPVDSCITVLDWSFQEAFPNAKVANLLSVEKIASSAFQREWGDPRGNLTHISAPHATVIEDGAFKFSGVEEVKLGAPDEVPAFCFDGCRHLKSVSFEKCPKFFGNDAFGHCASLASFEVNSVGDEPINCGARAFQSCPMLKSVPFLHRLQKIGSSAFWSSGLCGDVFITPQFVGPCAFSHCTAITRVKIDLGTGPGKDAGMDGDDLVKYGCNAEELKDSRLSQGIFACCTNLCSLELHGTVRSLPENMCKGCKCLTTVSAPTVNRIEKYAFSRCTMLSELNVGDVLWVGASAFEFTKHVKDLNFIRNAVHLGCKAFGWNGASELVLEQPVFIGDLCFAESKLQCVLINRCQGLRKAFSMCMDLQAAYINVLTEADDPAAIPTLDETFLYCSSLCRGVIQSSHSPEQQLFTMPQNIEMAHGMKESKMVLAGVKVSSHSFRLAFTGEPTEESERFIGEQFDLTIWYCKIDQYAFRDRKVRRVWSNSDLPIGAFDHAGVETVYLTAAVKSIGPACFNMCENLTDFQWEDPHSEKVERSIGPYAFYGCDLKLLELVNCIIRMGEQAFAENYLSMCTVDADATNAGRFDIPTIADFAEDKRITHCERMIILFTPKWDDKENDIDCVDGFLELAELEGVKDLDVYSKPGEKALGIRAGDGLWNRSRENTRIHTNATITYTELLPNPSDETKEPQPWIEHLPESWRPRIPAYHKEYTPLLHKNRKDCLAFIVWCLMHWTSADHEGCRIQLPTVVTLLIVSQINAFEHLRPVEWDNITGSCQYFPCPSPSLQSQW